jgi:hypothetical protein
VFILDTTTTAALVAIFDTVKTFATTSLLPAIIGLVVLSIGIRLGIGAVKKYSRGLKG